MSVSIDDGGFDGAAATGCAGCGSVLASGQRYCLECGTRRGAMPAVIAERISAMLHVGRAKAVAEEELPPDAPAAAAGLAGSAAQFMPEPRVAAVAVMCLLAFGVLLGSLTSQVAQSAGVTTLLYDAPAATTAPAPVSTPTAAAPAAAPAPVAPPAAVPAPVPYGSVPTGGGGGGTQKPQLPPDVPSDPSLPPVKHVFLIVLGDQGYDQTFGPKSTDTYLSKTLPGQGEVLSNYYAVTQGDLANEVALVSGQGPTPEIAAELSEIHGADTRHAPTRAARRSATAASSRQRRSRSPISSLPPGRPGKPTSRVSPTRPVRPPAAVVRQSATPTRTTRPLPATPTRPGATRSSISTRCSTAAAAPRTTSALGQFAADLGTASTTPSFSYIVPNACHDGGDQPCDKGQPAGVQTADAFLQTVVPQIQASPAYKDGGLIAITFAEASQSGPNPDQSACCTTTDYPNLPPPATAPPAANGPVKPSGGGGHVGMLLISPFVKPGTIDDAGYFNHFSMLLTIETLFGQLPLGYASQAFAFDSAVFNGYVQEN